MGVQTCILQQAYLSVTSPQLIATGNCYAARTYVYYGSSFYAGAVVTFTLQGTLASGVPATYTCQATSVAADGSAWCSFYLNLSGAWSLTANVAETTSYTEATATSTGLQTAIQPPTASCAACAQGPPPGSPPQPPSPAVPLTGSP